MNYCLTSLPGRDRTSPKLSVQQKPVTLLAQPEQLITKGNGGEIRVAEVVIQEGESLENALRRFKRKVQSEDIIKEIKKHSYFMKPGERRRAKEALSRKRLRKKQRREQD
jgi:small subunit ribosomal protein S21